MEEKRGEPRQSENEEKGKEKGRIAMVVEERDRDAILLVFGGGGK